jgi:hypoxanthine phosphoribosyltransferase
VETLNSVLSRQYSVTSDDWPSWVPDWRKVPSEEYVNIARNMDSTLVLPDRIQLSLHSLKLLRRSVVLVVDERIAAGETLDCCLSPLYQLSMAEPAAQVWTRLMCTFKT